MGFLLWGGARRNVHGEATCEPGGDGVSTLPTLAQSRELCIPVLLRPQGPTKPNLGRGWGEGG